MGLEKMIIQVGGQADLKSTIDQLKQVGKVDAENAEAFKVNSKKVDDSVKTTTGSIGQLGNALKNIATALPGGELISRFSEMAEGITASAEATKKASAGMNILKVAIASTGIGLLIVAFASLYSWFERTEKGAQTLRIITAVLGQLFAQVADIFAKAGEAIYDAVTNPAEAIKKLGEIIKEFVLAKVELLIGGIKGIGESFMLMVNGEFAAAAKKAAQSLLDINRGINPVVIGIETIGSAYAAMGQAAVDAYKKAAEAAKSAATLQQRENQLIKDKRESLVKEAELAIEIAELREKATNQLATNTERQNAYKAAIEKTMELNKIQLGFAKEEFAIEEERGKLHLKSEEELQKEAELEAQVQQIRANGIAELRRMRTQLSGLEKAERDKALKDEEDFAKARKAIQEEFDTNQILIDQHRVTDSEKTNKAILDGKQKGVLSSDKFLNKQLDEQNKIELSKIKARHDKEIAEEKEFQKLIATIKQEAIDVTGQILKGTVDLSLKTKEAEIDIEKDKNDKITKSQLDAIDKRESAGRINAATAAALKENIQKTSDKRLADLNRKKFEAEKKASIEQVLIQGAIGVAKSIAATPLTFGLPFSAFAAAQALIQAGFIAAQPTPAFKEGVIDFKGKGSETSDSNLVRISNRESVIKARATMKYKGELEAIQSDRFADFVYEKYVRPEIIKDNLEDKRAASMAQNIAKSIVYHQDFDDTRLLDAIKANKKINIANLKDLAQKDDKRYSI